jgi:hypothetical protein
MEHITIQGRIRMLTKNNIQNRLRHKHRPTPQRQKSWRFHKTQYLARIKKIHIRPIHHAIIFLNYLI